MLAFFWAALSISPLSWELTEPVSVSQSLPDRPSPPANLAPAARPSEQTLAAVRSLYDTYPFPPEPLLDEPPPGYNWRWSWPAAHQFCLGWQPSDRAVRILDAGCGTGVGTEYLMYLNPAAKITAIDLSGEALAVAKERCARSRQGSRGPAAEVEFHHLSLYDAAELGQQFDLINCVGVLHHLPDPMRGIRALADRLAPGGLIHIFVYGALGRWEIQLMQRAIALVQKSAPSEGNPYRDGVAIGRQLFAALPDDNRLKKREHERWSMENQRDECFADMYVHPQEIDYTIESLFDLIGASGLEFLGFSNPDYWRVDRLLAKAPDLLARLETLSEPDRYRLVELLDPEGATHYEFFLGKPPLDKETWAEDARLAAAVPQLNPCLDGWPSLCLFNQDYRIVELSEADFTFMEAAAANGEAIAQGQPPRTVGEILAGWGNRPGQPFDLDGVRSLIRRNLLLLSR